MVSDGEAEKDVKFVHSTTAERAATRTASGSVSGSLEQSGQALPQIIPDTSISSARTYGGGQVMWRVQRGGAINRDYCIPVFVDDEGVPLGPPGGTARLTAGQLTQPRAALDEATQFAERRW